MTTNCSQLKMLAPDGKIRLRDARVTKDIFRLIESVPSNSLNYKYIDGQKQIESKGDEDNE